MFTRATKNFGVWKETRKSTQKNYRIMSKNFLFSLGVLSFTIWLCFVIMIKIKQEFFFIESSSKNFRKINNIEKMTPGFFFPERKSALSIFLSIDKKNNLILFFDTGKGFSLPNQEKNFLEYLKIRNEHILTNYMLLRMEDPSISRIKIWADKSVSFKTLNYIVKIFSKYGYDDFDFAIES
jgi:hypothetical protein